MPRDMKSALGLGGTGLGTDPPSWASPSIGARAGDEAMTIRMAAIRLSMALLGAWLWLGAAAFAQESGSQAGRGDGRQAASPLRAGADRSVARLDDAQVRDLLLFYLGKTAAAPAAAASPDALLGDVEQKGELIRRNAGALLASLDDIPAAFGATYRKLAGDRGLPGLLLLIVALGLIIGVGYAAEWLYSKGVGRIRSDLKARAGSAEDGWFLPAVLMLLLDLVGIAVFTAGYVLAFLAIWQGNEARRQLTIGSPRGDRGGPADPLRRRLPLCAGERRPTPHSVRPGRRPIFPRLPRFGSRSSARPSWSPPI